MALLIDQLLPLLTLRGKVKSCTCLELGITCKFKSDLTSLATVSNEISFVKIISDVIIFLHNGDLIKSGEPDEL